MAAATLEAVEDRFPAGTSVSAYRADEFPIGWRASDGLPGGLTAASTDAVGSDGALEFAGLEEGVRYRAYASVSGSPRFTSFMVTIDPGDEHGFLNASDEGVLSDGSDAGASITAFLARAATLGVEARFNEPVTYTISAGVAIPSNSRVRAHDDAVFDFSAAATNRNAFTAAGTESSTVALTANAVATEFTVSVGAGNVAALGFEEGDWAKVVSDTYFAGAIYGGSGVNQFRGERLKVVSADDATGVITFLTPLQDGYPTADTARISKITPVENIDWEGGHFIGGGLTKRHTAIRLDKVVNARIAGVRMDYCEVGGVYVLDSSDVQAYRVTGDGGGEYAGSACYGISFQYTCQDCVAEEFDLLRYKHSVSLGGGAPTRNGINRRIKYLNGISKSTISTGLDAHSGCIDLLIMGCTVVDAGDAVDEAGDVGGGISIRCPDAAVIGNRIRRARAYGMWLRNQSVEPTKWVVDGNRVSSPVSFGIEINLHHPEGTGETIDGLSVTSNVVASCGDDGIKIFGNATSSVHATGVNVIGNSSSRNTGYGIHTVDTDYCTFSGNALEHNTLGGVKMENSDNNAIVGNTIRGDTAGKGVFLLTNSDNNTVTGNNMAGLEYGIVTDSSTVGNLIAPNRITSTTTALSVAGTGHITGDPRYKVLRDRGGQMSALGSGKRLLLPDTTPQAIAAAAAGRGVFYFDPADVADVQSALTTKLRVKASAVTNNVSPGIDFTMGLYPVSAVAGAAASVTVTLGTVVAGSTILLTPGANGMVQGSSGDFTAPAAGWYALVVDNSGSMAASSDVVIRSVLQARLP